MPMSWANSPFAGVLARCPEGWLVAAITGALPANADVHIREVEPTVAKQVRKVGRVVAEQVHRVRTFRVDLEVDTVAVGMDVDDHVAQFGRMQVDLRFSAALLHLLDDRRRDLLDRRRNLGRGRG